MCFREFSYLSSAGVAVEFSVCPVLNSIISLSVRDFQLAYLVKIQHASLSLLNSIPQKPVLTSFSKPKPTLSFYSGETEFIIKK